MKKGLDPNKIFAAFLAAALVAALGGFVSQKLVVATYPEKKGLEVVVSEASATATTVAAAPAEVEPIDKLVGNVETGQKLSRACAACHSFDKASPNRVGPGLATIYDGPQAAHEGFAYSEALKAHKGTWTQAELNKFLHSPKTYAPGTKMGFAGMPKAQDRADLIAYLKSLK